MKGYKFCLHKAYFNTGLGLTNMIKYIILLVAGGSILSTGGDSTFAVIGMIGYLIFCYFLGRWWYKSEMRIAEIEIDNQYNLFVKEIRKRKHI